MQRHTCTHMDQIKADSDAYQCDVASRHNIQQQTGTPHQQQHMDLVQDDQNIKTMVHDNTQPTSDQDQNTAILEDSPFSYTASAGKANAAPLTQKPEALIDSIKQFNIFLDM